MKDRTKITITAIVCSTIVVCWFGYLGYDSTLPLVFIAALWGGEKVLRKVFGK